MTTDQRLTRIEDAIASLNDGIALFKPLPLQRHPALREIVAERAARNKVPESRPYFTPEHTQTTGRVR
jgi:hypothetical protein